MEQQLAPFLKCLILRKEIAMEINRFLLKSAGKPKLLEKAVEVVRAVTDILLTYHGNIFVGARKNL